MNLTDDEKLELSRQNAALNRCFFGEPKPKKKRQFSQYQQFRKDKKAKLRKIHGLPEISEDGDE